MTHTKPAYWLIKSHDALLLEETKRKVKGYAARRGLRIAEALELLVNKGLPHTADE